MTKQRRISATEAARNFSDLLNRVFYMGETALLIRNGTPVARLVPTQPAVTAAGELAHRWEGLPHLSLEEAESMADELEKARRALPAAAPRWE